MKKGQCNKDIRPGRTPIGNLMSAWWGRFAGTQAQSAYLIAVNVVGETHLRQEDGSNRIKRQAVRELADTQRPNLSTRQSKSWGTQAGAS